MVRQPQAADQLFAPGLVGEHPVNHRAQQRPFVQRGPARHPQHRAGVLRQHGGQRFEHGMQVFERVVALAEQQHRRFTKGAGVPHRWGVKLRAQRFVAGVITGLRGQLLNGGTVKAGAPGHMAGVGQHGGFALGKGVKTGLVHVQQPARHMAVNQMLRRAGVQQPCWHAVIQVQGTVNHHALDAHQHRYPRRLGRLLYGAGGSVLGAPDMDKIRGNLFEQGRKVFHTSGGNQCKTYAVFAANG